MDVFCCAAQWDKDAALACAAIVEEVFALGRWSHEVRMLPYRASGPALPATLFSFKKPLASFFVCRLVARSVLCNAPRALTGAPPRLVQMFDGQRRATCRCRRLRRRPWRGGRYARSVAISPQFDLCCSRALNARRSSPTAVTRIPNRKKVPPRVPRTGASSLRVLVRWGRRSVTFNKCFFSAPKLLPPPSCGKKYFLYHPYIVGVCDFK